MLVDFHFKNNSFEIFGALFEKSCNITLKIKRYFFLLLTLISTYKCLYTVTMSVQLSTNKK